jgi:hypothetical protein
MVFHSQCKSISLHCMLVVFNFLFFFSFSFSFFFFFFLIRFLFSYLILSIFSFLFYSFFPLCFVKVDYAALYLDTVYTALQSSDTSRPFWPSSPSNGLISTDPLVGKYGNPQSNYYVCTRN